MLNKTDIINNVRKATGMSTHNSSLAVDTMLETISEAISKGERIELRGFGSFFVRTVAARKTAITPNIPSHGKVVFKPSRSLKKAVWDREE